MAGSVVVPLDGSSFSETAIPLAVALADATGADLRLVHVLTPAVASAFHPEEQLALDEHVRSRSRQYLDSQAAAHAVPGALRVHTALLDADGGVAQAVAEDAETAGAGWIVLTTHGAGGLSRWVAGSVADGLARRAATPLLFVRPWDVTGTLGPGEPTFQRILVCLDGSAESEAALGVAASLARAFGAALDLVTVLPRRPDAGVLHGLSFLSGSGPAHEEAKAYLDGQAQALAGSGVRVEAAVQAHDRPARGILTAAVERGADLVVMSTHGRSGLERAVLGSVADEVLQKGAAPLALVPVRGSVAPRSGAAAAGG